MTQQALTIAKALVKDAREIKSANSWYAEILAGTGTWLSISKLESPEVIDAEYFVPATKADPCHFQAPTRSLRVVPVLVRGLTLRRPCTRHILKPMLPKDPVKQRSSYRAHLKDSETPPNPESRRAP